MSTQLYRITRRGILHSRLEWPNGEPVKGSVHRMNKRNELVPATDGEGRKWVRRFYGTKMPATGEPVSTTIRLSHEAYQKHKTAWGLEPVILGVETRDDVSHLILPQRRPEDEDGSPIEATEEQDEATLPPSGAKKAPAVEIPKDWRSMNQSALSKIVSELYEQPYKSMPKDQAVTLIEAYLEEAGLNGSEA